MTIKNQIYKCEICGNIVEVLHVGAGELVCCGVAMKLMEEISDKEKEGKEKHFPIVNNNTDDIYTITVGSVPHPMEEAHFIEWIEVITDKGSTAKIFLSPNTKPTAEFCIKEKIVTIRSFCNVHGLWKIDL